MIWPQHSALAYHEKKTDEYYIKAIEETQNTIETLQKKLFQLKHAERSVAEFRIASQVKLIQPDIKRLMINSEKNRTTLRKIITRQINYLNEISMYFDKVFEEMEHEIGDVETNAYQLLKMVKSENRNDQFLIIENTTLKWAEKLKLPNSETMKLAFIKKMQARANAITSYMEYSKEQLENAILISPSEDKIDKNGYDTVKLLQNRFDLISHSFNTAIDILESNQIDTSSYKATLLLSTGEITPDIFNIDVIKSLFKRWIYNIKTFFIEVAPETVMKLIIFALILFISLIFSSLFKRIVSRMVYHSKFNMSKLTRDYLVSIVGKIILFLGIMIGLSQLGLNLAPVLAGLGVAGVVIGFALKETLSNFASGFMILIYRPFDLGDVISAAEITGVVSHMSLVSTTIKTYDNERLTIPNTKIWEGIIDNLTAERERRIDMIFSVNYEDDILKVEEVLMDILTSHPKVLDSPLPQVKVHKLADSSVDMATRPWVSSTDYWEVYWDITRAVKLRFDEEGISIPYKQIDVHLVNREKSDHQSTKQP